MAGYVLYLPGARGANPEHLKAVGLDGLLADGSPEFADCLDAGPDGERGLFAYWSSLDHGNNPILSTKANKWTPAKADKSRGLAAKRFWLGVDPERPVKPLDLTRKKTFVGEWCELADGNLWRVPSIAHLPHVYDEDEDGLVVRTVIPAYREHAATAERFVYAFFEACDQLAVLQEKRPDAKQDLKVAFDLKGYWNFTCDALAINYRVSREIVGMLGLVNDQAARDILKAATGFAEIVQGQVETNVVDAVKVVVDLEHEEYRGGTVLTKGKS
jgi:hypothetical protein